MVQSLDEIKGVQKKYKKSQFSQGFFFFGGVGHKINNSNNGSFVTRNIVSQKIMSLIFIAITPPPSKKSLSHVSFNYIKVFLFCCRIPTAVARQVPFRRISQLSCRKAS